jgi:hypothetical protein
MDSTEEVTKPGSSLLESMLTLDSTALLPRASPMVNHPASQAAAQALSKSWGSHGIMAEDTTSGASNVTVRLPIHTVSTSFGVLGSGSLSLKRNNVVGRPVKTDLSGTGRVLTQRKNPSVKLKQLSSGAMTSVFGGPVKGLKKALEEVSTLSVTNQGVYQCRYTCRLVVAVVGLHIGFSVGSGGQRFDGRWRQ